MASEREPPTTTDYVVTALSPVLVMLMVGSLVFFLVEVLYEGKYSGRLLYTLFFFVAGAVLVARIAIEVDATRAKLYGALLGIATYLALLAYVEYPGSGWIQSLGWLVNLGLMILIWWSANKLTWDCTHIDEKRKGAGRGLLSAAGLDADARLESGVGSQESAGSASGGRKPPDAGANPDRKGGVKKSKKPKHESRLWDWIERYKKYRDERRKAPHTPGVWVIYFALAALPVFAIGQSLIHPEDAARRHASFIQMVVYVASALMLLVTTSLLGLRRYLRQRKAKIPTPLAGGWLLMGGALVLVFLALGAFLPRPHSEVPWFGIQRAGKSDRDASKHAMRRDGAGKGDGAAGNKSKAGEGKGSAKGGKPGGGSKGEKGGGGKGEGGKGGKDGKSDQSGGDQKGGGKGQGDDREAKKDQDGGGSGGDAEENSDDPNEEGEGRETGRGESDSDSQLGGMLEKIAGVLRWIVIALVVVLVVVFVILAVLRYLAPFTNWAQRLLDAIRNWWANLWGKANPDRKVGGELAAPLGPQRPPPFHAFSNPFADGSAGGRDPAELVAYTFMALDSWAWDRDAGRDEAETPLEFISRLIDAYPDIAETLARFARLYAKVSYSHSPPPDDALEALEETWDGLIHGVGAVRV
jgi:hypothetical protein